MFTSFSAIPPRDISLLDNEEVIAEYLAAALEDPNPNVFLRAVADVAKARGIAEVAKASGLGRESLYKALAPGAKIRYERPCASSSIHSVCG